MTLKTGGLLKYGPISGLNMNFRIPCPIAASETFRLKSGRFITMNAGNAEVADDGDTLLAGWLDPDDGDGASSSTAGASKGGWLPANAALGVVFRIPVAAGTYAATMLFKTCDLVRATIGGVTSIQGAKLDASGEDNLIIVGGDVDNNEWVDVMINPSKITSLTGVV